MGSVNLNQSTSECNESLPADAAETSVAAMLEQTSDSDGQDYVGLAGASVPDGTLLDTHAADWQNFANATYNFYSGSYYGANGWLHYCIADTSGTGADFSFDADHFTTCPVATAIDNVYPAVNYIYVDDRYYMLDLSAFSEIGASGVPAVNYIRERNVDINIVGNTIGASVNLAASGGIIDTGSGLAAALRAGDNVTLSIAEDGYIEINSGINMNFTINNQSAVNGNFNLNHTDVGAAATSHTHPIAGVTGLQTTLDGKAAADHTHVMVSGIKVSSSGEAITGEVTLIADTGAEVTCNGSEITVAGIPFSHDSADSLTDAADAGRSVRIWTGTAAEWAVFTRAAGITYIVILHD